MKGIIFLLAVGFLVLVSCSDVKQTIMESFKNSPPKDLFKVFHYVFEKKYELNSEEGVRRYRIFKENLKKIEEVNSQDLPYKFGVNQFADLTNEEFRTFYLMNPIKKMRMSADNIRFLSEEGYFDSHADEDSSEGPLVQLTPLDHSSLYLGARDQGGCGSCWTYATTGVVEGAVSKKTGVKAYLSTQQLVDCDTGNYGCNGGNYFPSFTYVKANGIVNDSAYPYKAVQGSCKIPTTAVRTKITAFNFCTNYSSTTSQRCTVDKVYALLTNGPVAVGIDGNAIGYYTSGIFVGACSEDNHAVILVGYGLTSSGSEYWIVRNSWGTSWGMQGYIRIARNDKNVNSCYVNNEAYGVTV
jgi:C1A family cysteine protease